jgi:hypothetical protein
MKMYQIYNKRWSFDFTLNNGAKQSVAFVPHPAGTIFLVV